MTMPSLSHLCGSFVLDKTRSDPFEPFAKFMGVPWALRKIAGSFTPSTKVSESAGAITIDRKTPAGTLTNTVIVGKTDNLWATNDGKTTAAAFAVDLSPSGGPPSLAITFVHKLGHFVALYSALPDGTPGLLVTVTVFKQKDGCGPLTTIPPPEDAIQRLQQVFVVAK